MHFYYDALKNYLGTYNLKSQDEPFTGVRSQLLLLSLYWYLFE